jgi:5-methylcytosine-specific restriction endonuclease McrA
VRLIVTKAAAERGWTEPGEKCETADGTQVPMAEVDETFRKDDTVVQEVTFDEVDVQSIKTMKKYIPKRIRDAMEAQGMCCSECGSTKGLEIDHVQERRDGGATCLTNLTYRCRDCHSKKTARRTRLGRDPAASGK